MKKNLILILVVFLLVGCDAKYNIEVNDKGIKEKLVLTETNKELFDIQNDSGWTMRDSFEYQTSDFEDSNYSIKSKSTDDKLEVEYSSKNIEDIFESSIINQCYSDFDVIIDGDTVTIDTGSEFECYDMYEYLDSVEVRFSINHKVIKANSNNKEGNVYIWNFTKNSDKQIIISYSESEVYNKPNIFLIIGLSIAFVAILVLVIIIIKKRNIANKF